MNQNHLSFNEFEVLGQKLLERIDDLLNHFNIQYKRVGKRIDGRCIIHKSDNHNSFSIYQNDTFPVWKCWTGHCHEEYGVGLVGFVHGCLNSKSPTSFANSLSYIRKFLNDTKIETLPKDKGDFLRIVHQTNGFAQPQKAICSRDYLLQQLSIPSTYFMKRGITAETLRKFDVGDCWTKGKPMYCRAVCPIYDERNVLIGASGRRIYDDKQYIAKWYTLPKDIQTGNILYGLPIAKKHIIRRKSAIIVEGCGDVIKLHDIGLDNVVGIFGASIKQGQIDILNNLGIMKLIIMMDSDEAGNKAQEKIVEKCHRIFNIKQIRLSEGRDPGDLTAGEVEEIVHAIKN